MPPRTRPQCRSCHKAMDHVDAVAGAVPGAQDPAKPKCTNCELDNRMNQLFNDRRRIDAATAAGRVIW